MNYTRISKEKYYKLFIPELFSGEYQYNRCYATIVIENNIYKFAWESDLISPIIKEFGIEAVVVSVDHFFSILRLKDNIVLRCSLNTNILDVFFKDALCIGICEMNIVVLKMTGMPKYYKEYSVNDFISDYKIDINGIIKLRLFDDTSEMINLYDDNKFYNLIQIATINLIN